MEQVNRGTPLGDIILLIIEDVAIDSGLYRFVWKMQFEFIKKCVDKHSWLYVFMEYNETHNILINVKHRELTASRKNDILIMERAGD